MRILLFNTAHRWIGEAAGTHLLAQALAARGHQVTMAIPEDNKIDAHLVAAPYPIVRVPWRMQGGRGGTRWAQHNAVAQLLRDMQPDIVHVGRGSEHWCLGFVRRFSSIRSRIVRTRHVVLPMAQSIANRWLFRHATDAVTAISAAAFEGLGTLGSHLPPERRRVVLGAVDTERYSRDQRSESLRRELGSGPDTILIGCLGRWQRIKGADVFLEAVARVLDRHPGTRAVLAGRKVTLDHPRLRAMHDRFLLEGRVSYLGLLEKPEELIASLDIGVIASRGSEGFSRIAVEYFASHVPVVATRVGALPEIIRDGETGLLVPSEDPAAMTIAIERLVVEDGLRSGLAERAHAELYPRFSPTRLAEEMEQVYRATMDE